MKLSVLYFTYFFLSVVSTDRIYTISNDFSCESCLAINSLPQYNFSQVDRLHLNISPGRHTLNISGMLVFDSIPEVRVIGTPGIADIICTGNSGIVFSSVHDVVIANVSLSCCGGISNVNGIGASAVVLHLVSSFTLDNVRVHNSTASGIVISEVYGVAQITNSIISGSSIANVVCAWENFHSKNTTSESLIQFTVKDSVIEHGGVYHDPPSCRGETAELSGGMNIIMDEIETGATVRINNVTFYNNSGSAGGNMNIVLSKTKLPPNTPNFVAITIADSLISHGSACIGGGLAFSGVHAHCYGTHIIEIANTVVADNRAMEGGGGVAVWIDESCHSFDVAFYHVIFQTNAVSRPLVPHSKFSFTGGGLDFHYLRDGHNCRNAPVVVIDWCVFDANSAHSGGGLHITVSHVTRLQHSNNCTEPLVILSSSYFCGNEACYGAGAMLPLSAIHTGIIYTISVMSSWFENNTATLQASGMLIRTVLDDTDTSFKINLNNLTFTGNRILNRDTYNNEFPSTLLLLSLPRLSMTSCTFYRNEGSAIGAVLSRILFSGFVNLSGNVANVGSGLNLVSSYLELTEGSFITFKSNYASEVGGAIYSNNIPHASCFYTLSGDISNHSKWFQFIGNLAGVGGDVLYERARSECTLTKPTVNTSNFLGISEVINQPMKSLIASDPNRLCICQENNTYDCESSSLFLSLIKGSPLVVSVMLTDDFGFATPGYVSIMQGTRQEVIYSKWVGGSTCSDIAIPYSSNKEMVHFRFSALSYHHSSVGSSVDLFLSLDPCPSGFEDSEDGTVCECPLFSDDNDLLLCSVPEYTFTRLSNLWIGHKGDKILRIFRSCPFNYCKQGKIVLHDLTNSSSGLCASGRFGILCGECSATLSMTLGRGDCMQCSSNSIALVLAFSVLGVLLLVAITLLDLTITTGIINGIIFYAAFLHLNRTSFFPNYNNGNLFVIFISWLNLDFGFNVCFYDGLTPHTKVWLQFIFPVYLLTIEILVIVSSYWSSKLARVTGASIRVKIMSTVFLLGYMKLLRAVLAVFPYAKVHSPYNFSDVKIVWLLDGNIEYNSEHHTPLLVIAVLFVVVISIPYNIFLLFVQVLQRLPLPCKIRLEGVADAHVGPFKPEFRFWLGLLLFSYTFLVLLYYFTGGDAGINLTALVTVCLLLLLLNVFFGGVYKKKTLNMMESFFFFNLAILSALYLQMSYSNIGNSEVALYFLVTIAFVLILVVLLCQLRTRIASKDDNVCFTQKTPRVFTTSDYQMLNDEPSFETDYTNASTVIDKASEEETIFDSDGNIEVVPINWLPTNYPEPKYREHPDLLKSEKEGDNSHSDSSEKSIPQLSKVESLYLVVNKKEEEASLVRDPNNTIRSQRLSVDCSGERMYVIEDNVENSCTKGGRISEDKHSSNQTSDLQATETNKISTVCSPSSYQHRPLQIRRVSLPRRSRKRPPNRKYSTPMQPKRPQPGTNCCKCDPSFFLQSKIYTFKVDRSGGKHSISSHDVTLTVPPSAIREEHLSLDIEVGIMLNGPFLFPPNIRPISPILWICSHDDSHLCKPIEIILPHFVGRLEENESKMLGMQFMKASHYAPTLPDGTRRYIFDHIGSNSTSFTSHLGKLKTLHFCFLCIAAPESRALYERASYCLTRLDPVVWSLSRQKQEVYFVVSYFMKTCLKCIKDQAASNQQKIESQECFEFSNQNNTVPKLSVKVKNSIPGPRWTLVFENSRQILASEVDFWTIHDQGKDLEYMTLNRMYPPRFKLVVSGKNATEPAIAEIGFSGSLNDLDTDILFEPDDDCRSLCSSLCSSNSGSYRTPTGIGIPIHGISQDDWEILKSTEPHFPLLQSYISRVSVKWRNIGVQLEIEQNVLVGIGLSGHDLTTLVTEVLLTWRKNVRLPFTWATIIDVLAGDVIGENALAAEMAADILRRLVSY